MKDPAISFVYFDVGGVVIKDFSGTKHWENMCDGFGMNEEEKHLATEYWKSITPELCTTMPVDDMIPALRKRFHVNIPERYSMLEEIVSRFEQSPTIWPIIETISKSYKIGLLTNMYPGMFTTILEHKLLPPVQWDIIIDSTQIGYAKPDARIFQYAEKKAKTSAQSILFIDDNQKNVDAALRQNWNAVRYDVKDREKSNNMILDFLGLL